MSHSAHTALLAAIEKAGGQTCLAQSLPGVKSQSVVGNWVLRGRGAPVEQCAAIEIATGVSRRDLRPDDWGDIWLELIDADHPWPLLAEKKVA